MTLRQTMVRNPQPSLPCAVGLGQGTVAVDVDLPEDILVDAVVLLPLLLLLLHEETAPAGVVHELTKLVLLNDSRFTHNLNNTTYTNVAGACWLMCPSI